MSIPTKTTVLVIGGGPGGSYAASALAREGIEVVLLEAEVFPRYHVGESMVASIRHFLRFIDLDKTFNEYGFVKKTGAAFKLNQQRAAYTDFIVNAGPDAYAWNVIRSESDHLIFKHAEKSGAKTFDGVKVTELEWKPDTSLKGDIAGPGRPVSAQWSRKSDGATGEIKFDYVVDASGRAGIVSTKYLKNRNFNQDLKNTASWGYWSGAIQYGEGTPKEGQPFFEALHDGSGWAWFIPLHNDTVSVGIVMNQSMSTAKKQDADLSGKEFYIKSTEEARGISHLLANAKLTTDVKYASDWSYNAVDYACPGARIVGDAGAFIDPYFSSGVHLALSGALSAAVTICASIKGECDESTAWKWHSQQVSDRYTRFLLVVLSATKQIRAQDAPVLNNAGEDGFDDAFSIIRPIIQGIADVKDTGVKGEEIHKAVDFTTKAVERNGKMTNGQVAPTEGVKGENGQVWTTELRKDEYETQEAKVLKMVKDTFADYFTVDEYEGMIARLESGNLGLIKVASDSKVVAVKPLAGAVTKVSA